MCSPVRRLFALTTLAMLMTAPLTARAGEDGIVRHGGTADFPVAGSVSVPATARLVFVSGLLADVAKPDAPAGSFERYGDTETQAASVLGKIAQELAASGLTLADVVKMNVYLLGDPAKGGAMDFAGMMKAYTKQFGTAAQPNMPVRTTVQVAGLAMPGALVEIDVIAAR